MRDCQYVRGRFQPLTESAIKTVRSNIKNAQKTMILVVPAERGPDAPFSFDEVKYMWEEAFWAEASGQTLVVRQGGEIPPGGHEIRVEDDGESAREELASVGDPLWALALPHAIRMAIRTFDGNWRKSLRSQAKPSRV